VKYRCIDTRLKDGIMAGVGYMEWCEDVPWTLLADFGKYGNDPWGFIRVGNVLCG
jgi:hypothetical protein